MKLVTTHNRWLSTLALTAALGLSAGIMSQAQAGCSWDDPLSYGDCAEDGVEYAENLAEEGYNAGVGGLKTLYNNSADFINIVADCTDDVEACAEEATSALWEGVQAAGKFGANALEAAGDLVQKGLDEIEELALSVISTIETEALDKANQYADSLDGIAELLEELSQNNADDFDKLISAIVSTNASDVGNALLDSFALIREAKSNSAIDDLIAKIQAQEVGSLMITVAAGGGLGVGLTTDTGIAINIDAVIKLLDGRADEVTGSVGSFYKTGGVAAGVAGGGIDYMVGYHINTPDGVNGPGWDIGVSGMFKVGASAGVSFDISTPWDPEFVAVALGFGSGAKVETSMGASYGWLLGQFCSNWTWRALEDSCPVSRSMTDSQEFYDRYIAPMKESTILLSDAFVAIIENNIPITENAPISAAGNSSWCMHKKYGHNQEGNPIHLWDSCSNNDNTNKNWIYDASTGYIMLDDNKKMCIAKEGAARDWANGKIAHLWYCSGVQDNMKWTYEESTGFIRLRSNTNKCLHKQSSGYSQGNIIHLWDCDAGTIEDKKWSIQSVINKPVNLLVLLKNTTHNTYLKDDGDGSISASPDPTTNHPLFGNIPDNSFLWVVMDGARGTQYRNAATGEFLKATATNCVSGPVTGVGDAASWNDVSVNNHTALENYKLDSCCRVNSATDSTIVAGSCSNQNAYIEIETSL